MIYVKHELGGIKMKYCFYRNVATGAYNCPYASVVNNTICCTSSEKCYSVEQPEGIYPIDTLQHLISQNVISINPTPYEDIAANLLANILDDNAFPF